MNFVDMKIQTYQAVPNPVANPRVKLIAGAFANPSPRHTDADTHVIHAHASIKNILESISHYLCPITRYLATILPIKHAEFP